MITSDENNNTAGDIAMKITTGPMPVKRNIIHAQSSLLTECPIIAFIGIYPEIILITIQSKNENKNHIPHDSLIKESNVFVATIRKYIIIPIITT